MKLFSLVLLLVFHIVVADVLILKPELGKTYTVTGSLVSVELAWVDSGEAPSLDGVDLYTFTLCTGLNSDITAVKTLASNEKAADKSFTVAIPADAGASGVYFIQIYATFLSGYLIHYTNRFNLNGMTGLSKTSGLILDLPPQAQVSATTATTTDITATMDVTASFTVPYTLQTGIYRFAPMQTQPGSSVTATTWTPQFPTSAVTYYSKPRPSPDHALTITPGWLYSKTSYVNEAKALGTPTGAYAPTKVLKKPVINSSLLSKRFD